MSEEKSEQTFQVALPAKLNVSNICGTVEVQPGEDGIIQVTAIKHTHTGDGKRTEITMNQETDGTVKVSARYPDGSWSWLLGSHPCDVDFLIKAPRQCSIKLSGVSCISAAEGFEGSCDVNSISGDVTLRDMNGAIRIQTVSGGIEGEHISGSLYLEAVSGDLVLKDSLLPSINANSVSGNLQISTPLAGGPYTFKTVSGDVQLRVPPETRCTCKLNSLSGNLISSFPNTTLSRNLATQTINIQGGGVDVLLNSVSGDLSLGTDGQFPSSPANEGMVTSANRLEVLDRIGRGEITVEEGLTRLRS